MSRIPRPPVRVWVWVAATVAVAVLAGLLWRGSDAAATSSTTTTAADPASGSPGTELAAAWTADPTGPAPSRVVESGRVLVTRADGVSLRDPGTGEEAWHYTRTGARLCGATAVDDLVVVLFSTGGRCNEITALHAGTGVRAWYRTVGFSSAATLTGTDRIVLAVSPTGLATVDPTGNNIRWQYAAPDGCRMTGADVGSTGVVALQRCADGPVQALLFDGFDGTQLWTRDLGVTEARLVGADRLVDVVTDDTLQVLSPADGTTLQSVELPAAGTGSADEPLLQAGLESAALVWARGTAFALDGSSGQVLWSVTATGLPSVGDGKATGSSVLVPEDGAFVERDLASGAELARSTTAAEIPTGGRTAVIGPTVVVSTGPEILALS